MDQKHAVVALAALAQESRLAIFRELVQQGPAGLAAGKVAEAVGLAPSALSFHLKELANAGLVTQQRDGRHLIYRAAYAQMNDLLGYLTENCCQGEACIEPSAAARQC
jgi:DNA-binding transcriptional ArsR family regulator